MIAKIDRSEAPQLGEPIRPQHRAVLAAIVLVVCLLALLFARILTSPVKKLAAPWSGELPAASWVFRCRSSPGTSSASSPTAFNDMSASLQTKPAADRRATSGRTTCCGS